MHVYYHVCGVVALVEEDVFVFGQRVGHWLGLDELGVHTLEDIGQVVVVGEGEGLVPVVAVEPKVNVEAIADGDAGDRSGVELCFDSGVDVDGEAERVEWAVIAHVGLVLDSLKELLGPGLSYIFSLSAKVMRKCIVWRRSGSPVCLSIVVAIELRDLESVCFGTDEQVYVVVVQVKDLALGHVATLDDVALVFDDFVGTFELRVEPVVLVLGGAQLEDELAGAVEVLVGLGDVAVALEHQLLLILLGALCDVAEVLI